MDKKIKDLEAGKEEHLTGSYPSIYPEAGEVYAHYKGGKYKVHFLSKHTESGEVFVNYQSLDDGEYWTRPLAMWLETAHYNDISVNRFIRLKI